MKKITQIIILMLMISACSPEKIDSCFESSGDMVSKDFAITSLYKINVGEGIALVVKQGDATSVTVTTGENVLENISAWVSDGELFLRNSAGCNWSRTYNNTTIFVTTPQLERIYSASQFSVTSDGILAFPNLSLQTALYSKTASGNFDLTVNCNSLIIEDNAASYFKISGHTSGLTVAFYDGNARFDGADITADEVYVFQRSANDITVNPQQSLKGDIYSTGNVVSKHLPPTVEVNQHYTGRLIFN